MMFLPSCKEVCEHADDYIDVDGGAPPGRRLGFRLHLLICKHCRRFLRQLRLVMGAAPSLGPENAPTDAEIDALIRRLNMDRDGA